MTVCKEQMMKDGDQLVPRTCPTCRFGPCIRKVTSRSDCDAAQRLLTVYSLELAELVDKGEHQKVRDLSNMSFGQYIRKLISEYPE